MFIKRNEEEGIEGTPYTETLNNVVYYKIILPNEHFADTKSLRLASNCRLRVVVDSASI